MKTTGMIRIAVLFLVSVLTAFTGEASSAKPSADLCYQCHGQLRGKFARGTVHSPVANGRCTSCHDPHLSNEDKHLKDSVNRLCLGCHKGLEAEMSTGRVHSVLLQEKCTLCHSPHASELPKLLAREPNALCLECHKEVKKQLNSRFLLPPFREGKCLSCHRPHTSPEEGLLREKVTTLCQSCHGAKCRHNGISLASAVQHTECTACHSPHASNKKGVFNEFAHNSFIDGQCDKCHSLSENRPVRINGTVESLCIGCHPEKKDVLSKQFIHLPESPNSCTVCHNPHASRHENMLWKSERFGCFQCHQDTEKRERTAIEKQKGLRCKGVRNGLCSDCHSPHASNRSLLLKADGVEICLRCHEKEHKVSHPLREKALDPRTGQPLYCTTCHGIHAAENKHMLYFDRKKELCIQCHKKE
ncbi:MAG: cytochrome c3 family protein [Pseudomonadota bacterium]